MASKRLKKKRQKQAQQTKLQQAGYSPKQIKTLSAADRESEYKRIVKNERAKDIKYDRRDQLLNAGIPLSIITRSRLDTKAIDFSNKKQLSEWRRKGEKLEAIRSSGYRGKVSETQLRKSWQNLAAEFDGLRIPDEQIKRQNSRTPVNDTVRLSGKKYLYVGVCEIKDGFIISNVGMLSTSDLYGFVLECIEKAINHPDGSPSFSAVFAWAMGSKSDMEYRAQVYYKRGYDLTPQMMKLSTDQYQKITVSNKWSYREFLELMYCCMTHMKNSDVLDFSEFLRNYCSVNNFPFMDSFPYVRRK